MNSVPVLACGKGEMQVVKVEVCVVLQEELQQSSVVRVSCWHWGCPSSLCHSDQEHICTLCVERIHVWISSPFGDIFGYFERLVYMEPWTVFHLLERLRSHMKYSGSHPKLLEDQDAHVWLGSCPEWLSTVSSWPHPHWLGGLKTLTPAWQDKWKEPFLENNCHNSRVCSQTKTFPSKLLIPGPPS